MSEILKLISDKMPEFIIDNNVGRFVIDIDGSKITINAECKKTNYTVQHGVFYDIYVNCVGRPGYIDSVFADMSRMLKNKEIKG